MYFAGNNYEWPHGSIDAAKRALVNCGGEVVGEEYFDIGTEEFFDLLERVKNSGADVFVPYAAGTDQINLLNLFAASGLKQRMAVVMGHYDEAMVANLAPEVREGLFSSNTYFMTIDNEVNQRYLDRLAALPDVTGIWPAGNGTLTNFSEGTYVCVHAFAKAAEQAGSFDAEALVDALEHVVINAPQGVVEMDPVTHHAKVNTWLARCDRDGVFEIIESFGQIPPEIPQRYIKSMGSKVASEINELQSSKNSSWQLVTVLPYPLDLSDATGNSILQFNTSQTGDSLNNELLQQLAKESALLEQLANSGENGELEIELQVPHSQQQWVRLTPLYVGTACTHFALSLVADDGRPNKTSADALLTEELATEVAPVAVIITDIDGMVTYVNSALLNLWEIDSADMMVGLHISEFFIMPETYQQGCRFIDAVASNDSLYTAKRSDGKLFKVDVAVDPIKTRNNSQVGFVLSCFVFQQARPRTEGEQDGITGKILGAADIAIISVDEDGYIIQTNDNACELFGYAGNEMKNMPVHQLLPPHLREIHQNHIKEFLTSSEVMRPMGGRTEISGYKSDGTFFPAEASISKVMLGDKWIMVATLRDISEMKKAEEDLIRNATHDPLTNLPNRMLIHDRITSALGRSERTGKSVALMFVDVDDFKLVNDTYGHEIGDQLLIAIGNELVSTVRPGDTVARFGGDEFVVMCDQLTDWNIVTQLAERIVDRLKHPLTISGHEFYATVSIGVTVGHGHTHSAEELLRNADAAMYRAKERGRDGWMIFSEEMGENSRLQLKIATGLRNAVKNNELYTVLQPIVNSTTGDIIGAETLLRWKKGDEEISPGLFIPIAEMTGSILSIGEWVFKQACLIQADWNQSLNAHVPYITVNLSPRQLNEPELVHKFAKVMRETKANPNMIVLEITETTLMKDVEYTIRTLNELGRLGLSLAVDDFGTGYSSLSHLRRLPVDTLKVDRVFVDGIDHHEDTRSIATAIINMAHSLELRVTAEGVETEAN